jgi:hypothetical protein
MKVGGILLATAILAAVFMISCGDEGTGCTDCPGLGIFPNQPGDQWTYERTNLLTNAVDTVRVRAWGVVTMDDGLPATAWVTQFPDATETTFVRISLPDRITTVKLLSGAQDTVRIFADRGATILNDIYLIPFEVGQEWPGVNEIDTFRVAQDTTMHIGYNEYHSYVVQNGWNRFEWSLATKRWVVPHIGLVRMEKHLLATYRNEQWSWTLLNYDLLGSLPQPD